MSGARPPLYLLVLMTGLGPFTMQIIMPFLPALAGSLAVSYGTVQLTMSLYLAGVAVGQLFYGPLSDRFGRKPLLMVGLACYIAGSLLAALAPNAAVLILARVLQSMGGCAGLVLGRAMVRDAWSREEAATVLGVVSTVMAIAPMFAPLLGSLLELWFGWRASMVACLFFGVPLLLVVRWRLPETVTQPVQLPGLSGFLRVHLQLLQVPAFRGYVGVVATTTGVFFAFAAGAPLVVVQGMGHASTSFAIAFMMISVAWSGGTWTTARLGKTYGSARMLRIGTLVTTGGVLLGLVMDLLLPRHIVLFFIPMVITAWGNGMTQPNAIAFSVSVRPRLAGTASGLVGAAQMGCGALMTVITGSLEDGRGIATPLCMLAPALLCQVSLWYARRAEAQAAP